MTRIVGVDIPSEKRIDIALTYIYGVGRKSVEEIIKKAMVDPATRVHQLTSEEITRISKALEETKIEGDLREEISKNIKRLKTIGSYRGQRHARGLPARGQRTRTNARTKRGKRVTIGALKKEVVSKFERPEKAPENVPEKKEEGKP